MRPPMATKADTLGHIADSAPPAAGDRGQVRGRCSCRTFRLSASCLAKAASGKIGGHADGRESLYQLRRGQQGLAQQGYALRPLGNIRHARHSTEAISRPRVMPLPPN